MYVDGDPIDLTDLTGLDTGDAVIADGGLAATAVGLGCAGQIAGAAAAGTGYLACGIIAGTIGLEFGLAGAAKALFG